MDRDDENEEGVIVEPMDAFLELAERLVSLGVPTEDVTLALYTAIIHVLATMQDTKKAGKDAARLGRNLGRLVTQTRKQLEFMDAPAVGDVQ